MEKKKINQTMPPPVPQSYEEIVFDEQGDIEPEPKDQTEPLVDSV